MTIKEAWEYLNSQEIYTEEELNKTLEDNYIEIGFLQVQSNTRINKN